MAEIQMVYREGYCDFDCVGTADYNTQCHTQCAADTGCKFFNDGEYLPYPSINVQKRKSRELPRL